MVSVLEFSCVKFPIIIYVQLFSTVKVVDSNNICHGGQVQMTVGSHLGFPQQNSLPKTYRETYPYVSLSFY